jgi:hypothetical protein
MDSSSPDLTTSPAAAYLRAHGKRASASLLRKLRTKGPADPGQSGPKWVRDPAGYCLYRREDLDAYLEQWRAQLRPMAQHEQPERLRAYTEALTRPVARSEPPAQPRSNGGHEPGYANLPLDHDL